MAESKSVDSLLTQTQALEIQRLSDPNTPVPPAPEPIKEEIKEITETKEDKPIADENSEYNLGETETSEAPEQSTVEESEDDYGNKPKRRMYTDEDVERMMRDRLNRHRHAEPQATPIQPAQPAEQPQQGEEAWQKELEGFIENTIQKRTAKEQEKSWRDQQNKLQQEFEIKFTNGMEKYPDFKKVVEQQPITDSMLLAVRGFKDPAAFIYAASKTQAKELDRIARIPDPILQATELGRLDVQMRKNMSRATSAPKPIAVSKGDVSGVSKRSIDDLIRIDAQKKYKR